MSEDKKIFGHWKIYTKTVETGVQKHFGLYQGFPLFLANYLARYHELNNLVFEQIVTNLGDNVDCPYVDVDYNSLPFEVEVYKLSVKAKE